MTVQDLDFRRFPKQFMILPDTAPAPATTGDKTTTFGGWRILAARSLPIMEIRHADGTVIGVLLGWPILSDRLLEDGASLTIGNGGCVEEDVLRDLAGRATCLWRDAAGNVSLQLNSAGFLPAVYASEIGVVASSSTLIARSFGCPVDIEVAAIHAFPARRGYLPFGLAHHRGVRRLLPGHRLDMDQFRAIRVWPTAEFCAAPCVRDDETARTLLQNIADRVRLQASAVARIANPPRMYLSGGHDSRMILAALRDFANTLVCETVRHGQSWTRFHDDLDVHIARTLTKTFGLRHEILDTIPSSRSEVAAWLERTGWTYYEPLTELAATAKRHDRYALVMDGTGAEVLRAINWCPEDLDAPRLTRDVLLARARLPAVPLICAEAEHWLSHLPACDTTRALEVAKIDLMHGCWFGPSVYGHDIEIPSLSPFPSQRNHDDMMRLPKAWKMDGTAYRTWLTYLWPELLDIPANRAQGLARARFFRSEVKQRTPKRIKRWFKPYR